MVWRLLRASLIAATISLTFLSKLWYNARSLVSIEYTFCLVRVEICDTCKHTITERSTVECIRHALNLIDIELSLDPGRANNHALLCEVCEGRKHVS